MSNVLIVEVGEGTAGGVCAACGAECSTSAACGSCTARSEQEQKLKQLDVEIQGITQRMKESDQAELRELAEHDKYLQEYNAKRERLKQQQEMLENMITKLGNSNSDDSDEEMNDIINKTLSGEILSSLAERPVSSGSTQSTDAAFLQSPLPWNTTADRCFALFTNLLTQLEEISSSKCSEATQTSMGHEIQSALIHLLIFYRDEDFFVRCLKSSVKTEALGPSLNYACSSLKRKMQDVVPRTCSVEYYEKKLKTLSEFRDRFFMLRMAVDGAISVEEVVEEFIKEVQEMNI